MRLPLRVFVQVLPNHRSRPRADHLKSLMTSQKVIVQTEYDLIDQMLDRVSLGSSPQSTPFAFEVRRVRRGASAVLKRLRAIKSLNDFTIIVAAVYDGPEALNVDYSLAAHSIDERAMSAISICLHMIGHEIGPAPSSPKEKLESLRDKTASVSLAQRHCSFEDVVSEILAADHSPKSLKHNALSGSR